MCGCFRKARSTKSAYGRPRTGRYSRANHLHLTDRARRAYSVRWAAAVQRARTGQRAVRHSSSAATRCHRRRSGSASRHPPPKRLIFYSGPSRYSRARRANHQRRRRRYRSSSCHSGRGGSPTGRPTSPSPASDHEPEPRNHNRIRHPHRQRPPGLRPTGPKC